MATASSIGITTAYSGEALPRDHQPVPLTPPAYAVPDQTPAYETPTYELPPVPPPARSILPVFRLASVRVEGATVFTKAQFLDVVAPFLGKEVTRAELEEIRYRLTRLYVDAGYINSGAILPDQTIVNGEVVYWIIEGHIKDIKIRGSGDLDPDYIRDRLLLGVASPFNMTPFSERFQLLLNDPLIARMDGRLRPGDMLGEAIFDIDVTRGRPYQWIAALDNYNTPASGALNGSLEGVLRNTFGKAETTTVAIEGSEGASLLSLSLSAPLNTNDTQWQVSASRQSSAIVEAPLNALDIKEESKRFSLGLSHPIIQTLTDSFVTGGGLMVHDTSSYLFGHPFSFSSGPENGKSKVVGIQFSQQYQRREATESLSLYSTLTRGTGWGGATVHTEAPDGHFTSWLGQGQYAQRLGKEGQQVVAKATLSLSNHALLPSQRLSIGGFTSVRGYRENTYVRDEVAITSLEYHYPVNKPLNLDKAIQCNAIFFIDYGSAWDNGNRAENNELSSMGVGIHTTLQGDTQASLHIAHALQTVPPRGEYDWQDDGIHFRLTTRLF